MKKLSKSVVCIFMTIVVVISILPVSAFAAFPSINRTDYWSFPTPDSTLSFGRNGDDVRWLQCALNNLILFGDRNNEHRISPSKKLDVDGAFGNATRDAVREFQKQYKLTQDGLFGSKSRDMMINVLRPHSTSTELVSVPQNVPDGTYYIRNKLTNKYLDVMGGKNVNNANVAQYHFMGNPNQQFEIKYENGFYKIYTKLEGTKRCLDLQNSSAANTNGTDLKLFNAASSYKEQNFIFKRLGDGSYEIGSVCSNGEKVLEVENSSYNDCATVQINQGNSSKTNDDWYLEPISVPQNVQDGIYYIRNKKTNKYLDICGGKNENRARIVQYQFHGDTNQQFEIKYENGFYKIYTKLEGNRRCLDLHSSSEANTNDTDLQLFNAASSYMEQNFILKRLGDGSYEIGSVCSNGEKVLEVANSSYSDGAAVQIWQGNSSKTNDDWYLEPADAKQKELIQQAQNRVKSRHQYDSIDDAAKDFVMAYDGMSVAQNREYGSSIVQLDNGKYTFTHIIWGRPRGNSTEGRLGEFWENINTTDAIAYVHTHGQRNCEANLVFSYADMDEFVDKNKNERMTYAYVGNAHGEIYKYTRGGEKANEEDINDYGTPSGKKIIDNLSWCASRCVDDTAFSWKLDYNPGIHELG